MNGKLTILLAAYKGNAFAGAQIESILAQDYRDFKLVLSDDGEDTAELLEHYAQADPERVEHHRSGRRFGSAQKHFLYLLEQYRDAPYIMLSDQDDVWHPDKVRLSLEAIRREEALDPADTPVLVHTDARVVGERLELLDGSFMHFSQLEGSRLALNELTVQNVVTGHTVIMNRALTELVLEGKDRPEIMMHDWWMALCAAAFGRAVFLNLPTSDYRQHGGNQVGAKSSRSLGYILGRIRGRELWGLLESTAAQAGAFEEVYRERLSDAQREELRAFAALPRMKKSQRIRTFRKYGFWKKDLKRRLGQLLWW